jgi:Spy/CpxP family protein refolding chaperone
VSDVPQAPQPDEPLPPPASAPPRSRVWREVLLGLVILLCGIIIGAGGTVLVGRGILLGRGPGQPDRTSREIARHMSERLDLTPDQQKQVRDIVRTHMVRINEVRNRGRQEAEQELDLMRDDVAKVLTPEQAQAWRTEFERMRRFAPRRPPGGGRPEGPGGRGGRPGWGPSPEPGPP